MKLTRAGCSRPARTHVAENPVIRIRSAAIGASRSPRHALEFPETPAGTGLAVFIMASHHFRRGASLPGSIDRCSVLAASIILPCLKRKRATTRVARLLQSWCHRAFRTSPESVPAAGSAPRAGRASGRTGSPGRGLYPRAGRTVDRRCRRTICGSRPLHRRIRRPGNRSRRGSD